jgi:endonuclease/exonuclease/phosphatase (EEP) superfamily protein YafD
MMLYDLIWGVIYITALGACLGTVAGFMGRIWWRLDLFSHFRVQYFIILTTCAVALIVGGKWIEAIPPGAGILINLSLILPYYDPRRRKNKSAAGLFRSISPNVGEDRSYHVLLSNVLQKNTQHYKVIQLIHDSKPDFFVLIEVNQAWIEALQPSLPAYPYCHTALREDNYGMAFFSKRPVEYVETIYFSEAGVPSIQSRLNLDGHTINVIGTHPPPPKSRQEAIYRNAQLLSISKFVAEQDAPCMVMGDLNITPWSPFFRDFLRVGGIKDSQTVSGLQFTWPRSNPFLRVPIDHILVSPGIEVFNRRLGPAIGSDHFPVLLDFVIL